MGVTYAWEKFMLAVHGMARSPASIQDRIEDAFVSNLMNVDDEDLQGDLWDLAAKLQDYRHAWDAQPGDGKLAKWAEGLSTEDAAEVAHWIVGAYDRLCAACQDSNEEEPAR